MRNRRPPFGVSRPGRSVRCSRDGEPADDDVFARVAGRKSRDVTSAAEEV